MRFLCDEMLQGLGRLLRAAGYDALIAADSAADSDLLRLARHEERLLITRDRNLFQCYSGADDIVVLLTENHMPGCARELSQKIGINWLLAPFSRCLVCNQPLILADQTQRTRVPDDVLKRDAQVYYCPQCDRVYWEGSHVRRMRRKLHAYAHGQWHGKPVEGKETNDG